MTSQIIRLAMSELGQRGKGKAKTRTPDQCRKAAAEKWRRWREKRQK